MSFKLPLQGTPAREALGDIAALVEILNPANALKLLTTQQARRKALDYFETEKDASRINFVIIRQDTAERHLISIGRKGGWKKIWNFGTGRLD